MVSVTLNTKAAPAPKASPSLDTRILGDVEYQTKIRSALDDLLRKRESDPRLKASDLFWDKCKKKFLEISLSYAKNKRLKNQKERRELTSRLQSLDRQIERNPLDIDAVQQRANVIE
ncbi:hypothetical protein BGX26_009362, partial [Mortierella sp. AD094]